MRVVIFDVRDNDRVISQCEGYLMEFVTDNGIYAIIEDFEGKVHIKKANEIKYKHSHYENIIKGPHIHLY